MTAAYERGEVYWTALDPARGHEPAGPPQGRIPERAARRYPSEQAKTRPCVIVSNTAINRRRGTIVVVPLTTTPQSAHPPLLVAVPSMGAHAKSRTEHLRAVDKSRLGQRIGRLSDEDMLALERAIAKVLALG